MSARARSRGGRWAAVVPAVYSALLTLVVAGPLLAPGYLLLRDAVSTPRSYLTDAALGLGDAAPRAVPQDALLAALSTVADGGLVVKAILLAALWAAGYGAAVLARELLRVPLAAQLVAVTVAIWNPFVAERLLQGHWSLLTGYAALPWTALAAHRLRCRAGRRNDGRSTDRAHTDRSTDPTAAAPTRGSGFRDWAALAACFAAAGLTPTGALLAGIVGLLIAGRRNFPGVLLLLAAASAPWLVATVASGAGTEPSDPAGIAAFAARAEPGLGTLGSLAGLGGIWNADAVPWSRTTPLAVLGTAILLVLVAFGVRAVAGGSLRRTGSPPTPSARTGRRLLGLAVAAVLLPALAATAWGMDVLEWLVVEVPGAGLLRDTQKYVALAMPAYALCAAAGCVALAPRLGGAKATGPEPASTVGDTDGEPGSADSASAAPAHTRGGPDPVPGPAAPAEPNDAAANPAPSETRPALTAIAALFIAALILPLIDLAWGVGGELRAVRYPAAWQEAAERVDGPGDVAVLPGGMFRRFPYSGTAPVLDPAPRMLPNDVLQTGELPVRGQTVSGEGARARQVENLLLEGGSPEELAALGVGWVLVEHRTPGPTGEAKTTLAHLEPVLSTPDLALYRVPGVIADRTSEHRELVIGAHILWATLLFAPLLTIRLRAPRR
ncbi:hypothetical protein [Nocardia cyriacigeorgica]|uniref:hypothetical protein n=1 Tax=Nocardia cyriacigeorgica TaxID=135487 RepID=UPI00189417D0|nr:hypothetical protein [Nocardia cyriacigeorgica]MBF6437592.1 hypothetical protein [Nocardia cyriacigeorgica]